MIDVAKEASVGVMSVSRVLNNHPSVKQSTRTKVMKAMAKIGYAPNDAARMLKGRKSRTIGLIIPDLSDYYASCFHAIQAVAMRYDHHTVVVATGKNVAVEDQQVDSLRQHGIAGLLIVSTGSDGLKLRQLQNSGVPIVAFDRPLKSLRTDSVLVENREGAMEAVRHLIGHGHTKIACVGYDSGSYTVQERIEGYRQAMREAGLEPMICKDLQDFAAIEKTFAHWVHSKDRPTALFSLKRITSIMLLQALHLQRLRVPEDMAMVGFDDFELAEMLGTPLTVAAQSPSELARTAAELLFKKIGEVHSSQPTEQQQVAKIFFPVRLVVRRSCGCPQS